MLKIANLRATVDDKEILKGLNIEVKPGEVHAIMGPNGSGKSTLSNVLAGRDNYHTTDGTVLFEGKDLLTLAPEERAREGVFLAFQYPVEIPGVSNLEFLKTSLECLHTHQNKPLLSAVEFMKLAREKCKLVDLDTDFLKRGVNEGFSGGEKKRNDILQMLMLEPTLCLLDETDSGLDIDALKVVADGINALRSPDRSFVLITHYQRLLDYVQPDFVHVLVDGQIVKSGGSELALELEEKGYSWLESGTEQPANSLKA
ncbi:Fe-S cluster assembly ATPase SufC [Colwellia sp. C1TZA3]|uniref:Fe-S cluster assembly ATPase SufC n=1 Tax=Colwellia sp. C1TZA3 TaxID=2508879 RepID=UPI0011BA4319|nr:Fe-S cluster assembly ATPase SufC [Colwellia sp. C1TZA3]TWX73566.1 Fe-S cluster assembly ATPase SufC [Colwellia sp. C1TZA3]